MNNRYPVSKVFYTNLFSPGCLVWLPYSGFDILAALSVCHGYPILPVLFYPVSPVRIAGLSSPGCYVLAVLFWLSCLGSLVAQDNLGVKKVSAPSKNPSNCPIMEFCPLKKNNLPHFPNQRYINSYCNPVINFYIIFCYHFYVTNF